jgi:uncharacterized protein (DUF4415 family)
MAIQFREAAPEKATTKPVQRQEAQPSPAPPPKPVPSIPTEKRGRGRPPSGKEPVTILISSDILKHYRTTGKGWQARLDADLRKALKLSQSAASASSAPRQSS